MRERVLIKARYWGMLFLPPADGPKHFLLMGGTGTGKITLILQMLLQLAHNRQTAIMYDPAREYI